MQEYEPIIGMEVHAELLTESKMFCGCTAEFGGEPNTRCCPVCLGLPGSLPVINVKAVQYVVKAALALNCSITPNSIFHRKNYFYPDLPKGYQISQYGDTPIGQHGWVQITVNGATKKIAIRRVHLEEDTGKLLHVEGDRSHIDYNRGGVPLMEIVTQNPPPPGLDQIQSAEEAKEYLVRLRAILTYIGVNDGKLEEGSLRCEPNISLRPVGQIEFGVKTELKNLNSFRAVLRGIEYELERQEKVLLKGGKIVHETRRWDDVRGATASMRSKEFEQEYRYFPEPDLTPLRFDAQWVEEQRKALPELPDQRKRRFIEELGIPEYDAEILTDSRPMAEFFEEAVKLSADAKSVSNWMMGDLLRLLNATGTEMEQSKLTPSHLTEMLNLIGKGTISGKIAKTVFEEMFGTGRRASEIVEKLGLTQITDESELIPIINQVLDENPRIVQDVLGGKDKSLAFLVGQTMRYTKGRANPPLVNRLLRERLESRR
ncbi:MAG: Asp-tRNA(Asn)/Glu-tRNA(Gln) amidotransferase subunit GatB [Armatimonadota bacterium]|nr:Asp-tRNA(Asn)/Glu-tRNA(Gln) amidotransferase subunit GatB [Armatimonadota bacterium]